MKLHLTLILLLLGGFLFSQNNQEKKVVGYILNDNNFSIEGIHVLNNSNGEATITNTDGRFEINQALMMRLYFQESSLLERRYY